VAGSRGCFEVASSVICRALAAQVPGAHSCDNTMFLRLGTFLMSDFCFSRRRHCDALNTSQGR
jgi:hypothetical protein